MTGGMRATIGLKRLLRQSTAPEKKSRPWNDPQPWNDHQIDPEMIHTFLLVDHEMIPKKLGNGD